MTRRAAAALLFTLALGAAAAQDTEPRRPQLTHDYDQVIQRVASMVGDAEAQRLAQQNGLQILNVMWEDTGRWQGSSVGPNISDVTIEVAGSEGAARRSALMPVIRTRRSATRTSDRQIWKNWRARSPACTGRATTSARWWCRIPPTSAGPRTGMACPRRRPSLPGATSPGLPSAGSGTATRRSPSASGKPCTAERIQRAFDADK